jgi:D-alanyl-D-alanine carboxypeptidase/D-alanyl-D-alanine-endopeptidase (penicillin-binding protein 4)
VTRGLRFAAYALAAGAVLLAPACASHNAPGSPTPAPFPSASAPGTKHPAPSTPPSLSASARRALSRDLDTIFDDPVLARALLGVRVDVLGPEPVHLYARNAAKLVMPASNMKLLTVAVAADRLGWDYRYKTRLEAAGTIENGVLHGDLVVVGSGDPSIEATETGPPPLFGEWAEALRQAGIQRVDGRLIGDDDAFEEEGLGAGWAWDYLAAGYAAPSGALNYNLNQITIRATPGAAPGDAVRLDVWPAGHGLTIVNELTTGAADSAVTVDLFRLRGSATLAVRGNLRAGGNALSRTASVDNPTRFFVEAFRLALETGGVPVRDGAWDKDDVRDGPPAGDRRVIATHDSAPFSELAVALMKASLNFDTEVVLKTIGVAVSQSGTTAAGQAAARETLTAWGIPPDAYVMYDGSGLSRYNYVSADAIVTLLTHVWQDPRLRDPFIASLPIAGVDGTLATRMRGTVLEGKVDAKTGTISNVRSLSGFLVTKSGEHIVFSMIANHFTSSSSAVDAVVEKALARLAER